MIPGRALLLAIVAILVTPSIAAWMLIAFDHPDDSPPMIPAGLLGDPAPRDRAPPAGPRTLEHEVPSLGAHRTATLDNGGAGERGATGERPMHTAVVHNAATAAFVLPPPTAEGVPVIGLPLQMPVTSPAPVPPVPGQTSIAYQDSRATAEGASMPSGGTFPVAPVAALHPVILAAPEGQMPLLGLSGDRPR